MDAAVEDAGKLYRDALGALSDQRRQIEEDLEFSDPSNPKQWDEREQRQREQDPGGARPCLVMDQIGQYISNVAGQVEQRPPSIHALPAADGADIKVAEKLDGFFRHVEHASRASQHYTRALTSAARAGVGYLIVRPELTDRALNYQEPRIDSEGDPLRVVFDPWSVALDGADANFGFLLTPFSLDEFKRRWGKDAAPVNFGDEAGKSVRDERDSVEVAEIWRIEDQTRKLLVCVYENGDVAALSEDDYALAVQNGQRLTVIREYSDKYRCVKWSRMSGAEVLTPETEYPASGIGIVPMYGYVGWSKGRMHYCGMARRARQPQRAYNYHVSEVRAYMNDAPKSPWLASKRAVKGVEQLWDRASVERRAWLPYNDQDSDGQIAQPTRMPVAMNLQNHVMSAEQALKDIQAALGMYQANLGAPSNESSGVAIESRKQQGEASTAHFPSHMAASLSQVGKLVMDMVPRLFDVKRQMRILGIDQTPGVVTVNPSAPQAATELDDGALVINPNVGKYDVRVVVGASFSTQRQQAQEAYTEMMRNAPALIPAVAPLWAQSLDVPHADKLAQVLTAVAPDPVKAILQPNQAVSTAKLQAENQQLRQALQEAIQHAQEAQAEADQAQQAAETNEVEDHFKAQEMRIKAFDAETKRLQAMGTVLKPQDVQGLVVQTIEAMLQQPTPLAGEAQEVEPIEGPGPDGAPMHEQAEGEAPEPMEVQQPAPPSPEVIQGLEQLAQANQALQQGQEIIGQALAHLIQVVQMPRERVPVRNKKGDIERVIDRIVVEQQ